MSRGIFIHTERQDLPDTVQKYLKHVKARKSDSTHTGRRQSYRHYVRWCDYNSRSILQPSVVDCADFISAQLTAGYRKGTIENRVYALSAFWQWAARRDFVGFNPVRPADGSKGVDLDDIRSGSKMGKIRYIEVDEFEKLYGEAERLRDELILRILWECGLRSYELVNLKIEQVEKGRDENKITLLTAKQFDDTYRTVFYSHRVKLLLEQWLDRGGREVYLNADISPYLLIGKGSDQLNANRPTEIIGELAELAGVQSKLGSEDADGNQRRSVTAHALRHSFAVHRVKNGCPIVYLSDLLGHSDITQTREYLRFRDDDIREADKKYRPTG